MGTHSFFRIGADVELWRVVGHLCLLLVFMMILEQALHKAERALQRYPKYFDMLRKAYRELMILGLLSLGLKAAKALALTDSDSMNLLAFEAADVVIFLSAVALILQALCIFAVLRRRNKRVDRYELISNRDLIELVSHHEAVLRTKTWLQRNWPWTRSTAVLQSAVGGESQSFSSARYDDMVRLRVLRHFFLRTQRLPELFPFAKYLRKAQDNQITHMIEVEVTVWVLLMGITWLLDKATSSFHHHFDTDDGLSLVAMFFAFAWSVTLMHALLAIYLKRTLGTILSSNGYRSPHNMLKCLRTIADDEDRQLAIDMVHNAVEEMQRVQDEKELEQVRKDAKYTGLARHDSGIQLFMLLFRRCRRGSAEPASIPPPPRCRRLQTANADDDLESQLGDASIISQPKNGKKTEAPALPNVWFSRKVIHFFVKLLLILNGFFFALMCQAVLYELPSISREAGVLVALSIPLPLFFNMAFFQPRIFRDYVLVACVFKVDVATLSEVISQFSESVELRAEFVSHLTSRMRENGQTLDDLRRHFHVSDPNGSGLIELEELRQILRHFGCQVSYFRFNDVAKLLFRLKGTCVEYAQVERLLELAHLEDEHRVAQRQNQQPGVPQAQLPHYLRTVMTEEAELQGRDRYSTMLEGAPVMGSVCTFPEVPLQSIVVLPTTPITPMEAYMPHPISPQSMIYK